LSDINVLLQSKSASVLTDGAIYLGRRRTKGAANAAPKVRGGDARAYLGWAPICEEISAAAPSFDELKKIMPELPKACTVAYEQLLEQCTAGPDIEVVVAGINGQGQPEAYITPSHDRYGQVWSVLNLEGLSVTPANDVVQRHFIEIANGRTADELDPVVDGLAILGGAPGG
jgi:hypothetical protein